MDSLKHRLAAAFERIERRLLPPVLEPGAMPWMSLFYTMFLVMPLIIPGVPQPDWPLTILSLALFIPVYFHFYWARGWRRTGTLLVMGALAVALLPANPFSNTYLIYANVLAAFLSMRAMVAVWLVTQGVLAAAVIWLGLPEEKTQAILLMNAIPSTFAVLCNRIYIANQCKNQALRLTQDEVQRLARVAERERISRDLHDLLGHTLSVVALKAELANKLFTRDPAAAAREMADVERVAREALGQVRRAVSGMRALGLRAELANARLAMAAVEVDFEYRADDLQLHPELETILALSLREAATNVIRHANARRCRCELSRRDDRVRLSIVDDGDGGVSQNGNGLSGMRERIEQLGGTLAIESPVGAGTTLVIDVPFRAMPSGADGAIAPPAPRKLAAVG